MCLTRSWPLLLTFLAVEVHTPTRRPSAPRAGAPVGHVDLYGDPVPAGALARLGTVRLRHPSHQMPRLAFTPDGRWLLSAGADGAVRFWDPASGRETRQLKMEGPYTWGLNLILSTEGKTLAFAQNDAIQVWDLATGIRRCRLSLNDHVGGSSFPLAFSPDGQRLASWGGYRSAGNRTKFSISLWNLATGEAERSLPGHDSMVQALAFTPDGRTLVSAGLDLHVRLWDPATGKEYRSFEVVDCNSLSTATLSPDGKLVAVGGQDAAPKGQGFLALYDLGSGKLVRLLRGHTQTVASAVFSRDGRVLASASTREIILWEAATGKQRLRIGGREGFGSHLALAPDGRTLASTGWGRAIRLWDTASGKELQPRDGHESYVSGLAFAPDGHTLAGVSYMDGVARLWDTATARSRKILDRHQGVLSCALFTFDGRTLITAGMDSTVRFWDTISGKERRVLRVEPVYEPDRNTPGRQILSLALSADGQTLYAWTCLYGLRTADFTTYAWDVATGRERTRHQAEEEHYHVAALAPEGSVLVTGRGTAYDLARGRRLPPLHSEPQYEMNLALSPGGKLVAGIRLGIPIGADGRSIGADGRSMRSTILVWELASCRTIFTAEVGETVSALAFASGGRILATGGPDAIRCWDMATGQEVFRCQGHETTVHSLAFSPDGAVLASGLADSSVLLWDLASAPWRSRERSARSASLGPAWADLASADGRKGQAAVWALAEAGDRAVALLTSRLPPATNPDPVRLGRLVEDLDSPRFHARERASQELGRIGELAEPFLKRALARRLSTETVHRIEAVLSGPPPVRTAEGLRRLRAIWVLELIGTPRARRLLRSLAAGATAATDTQEAASSLQRLAHRAGIGPSHVQ